MRGEHRENAASDGDTDQGNQISGSGQSLTVSQANACVSRFIRVGCGDDEMEMGRMRGRRPQPSTLKILHGSRKPLNSNEPFSPLLKRMPAAPQFLDDEGRRVSSALGRRFHQGWPFDRAQPDRVSASFVLRVFKRRPHLRTVVRRRGGARPAGRQPLHQPVHECNLDVL